MVVMDMGTRSGRRGEVIWDVIFIIIQFVLALAVFFPMFYGVNSLVTGDDFEQNYISRDIALLINTLYAAPGYVVYDYPLNISSYGFNVTVDDEKVSVIAGTGQTFSDRLGGVLK
ncbi:hypothetical protein JW968_05335 [Candidatus Woesearchaeota archaeon]|nr:hypothetical protein [Candidatus Woesearchaeota archaeon]